MNGCTINGVLGKKLVLCCVGLLSLFFIRAQCPEKDSLLKRLIFFKSSTDIPPAEQLEELLNYELRIKACSYNNDTVYALLLQRIGVMYSLQSDYLKALQYIKQSIKINTPGPANVSVSIRDLIRSYYNLSVVYDKLNRTVEKITAIDSCVAIGLRTGIIDQYSLYPLKEKVEYLFDIGDYQRAFTTVELGESIIKKYLHGNDSIDYIINFMVWKVNALSLDFKNYNLAEKIIGDKIKDCELISAKQYLGNLYEQLAMVMSEKGDFTKAEFDFEKAFQFHKNDYYDLGCEQTLTNLGYYLFFKQNKNYKKAISTYKKALQYINKNKTPNSEYSIETLNIFANIAKAFIGQGHYDSAFYYFQKAFDQIKPGINEEGVLHSPLNEFVQFKTMGHIVNLLIGKADAYLKRFKDTKNHMFANEAIRIYKVSDLFINRIKSEQSEVLSKLFWRNNTHLLYEHAIDACYLTNNPADALFFFERSRAVLLNDQLSEQHWMDVGDILKNTQLKKKILLLERELNDTGLSSGKYAEIQRELFTKKMELDRLVDVIKAQNPLYYQGYLDSTVVTPQDIQRNLLKDHQALIEFFSGDSNIYCYVITPQKIDLTRIDRYAFDSTTRMFNLFVSDYDLLNRHFTEFLNTSNYLYRLIFQKNPVPAGRIIVSPDGYYFPFEALVTNNSAGVHYFLYDHAVSYTYSARYLMNWFALNSTSHFRNFIGVAPTNYFPGANLASLPGSDRSLKQLKSYFSYAENLTSTKASKNNFLQQFSKYKIIQLYTHAVSNSNAGEPIIYFADSVLYLSDLIGENKPVTRLIVLSACETARGKFYQGEGVFSFSRGFAALGIPSSVTNLWSVENESTYKLTELFYKYLAEGFPIDIALQKAKEEFIKLAPKEKVLPYFWASPILVGKTDRIEFKEAFKWKTLSFMVGAGALLLWGLFKMRKIFSAFF